MLEALKGPHITMLHVTSEKKLKKLLDGGEIYPSGGCLVGAIYCSLLFPSADTARFRPHNLGQYILQEEAPRHSKKDQNDPVVPIIFEGDLETAARNNLVGIDYLRLGEIHLSIYQSLEYLMFPNERKGLEADVVRRIRAAVFFLGMCPAVTRGNAPRNAHLFLQSCAAAIQLLPVVGYLYFEAIVEYLLCYQACQNAHKAHEQVEFYNGNYKTLAFEMRADLANNFDLSKFDPTPEELHAYISTKSKWGLNVDQMMLYLEERVAFLVCARLIPDALDLDWRTMEWRFDNLSQTLGPLVGHLVHRLLRKYKRSRLAYYFYDHTKAMQAWNYWNQNEIAIPFNGIIPKGEVGVNPAHSQTWKLFRGKYDKGHIEKEIELALIPQPRLVDQKYSTMRSRK